MLIFKRSSDSHVQLGLRVTILGKYFSKSRSATLCIGILGFGGSLVNTPHLRIGQMNSSPRHTAWEGGGGWRGRDVPENLCFHMFPK